MDQVKEFLRQAIKYRFWILIGLALLLPTIAYFATAGSIKAETATKAAAAKAAHTDIKKYESFRSGVPFHPEATSLITERTSTATQSINEAWRLLYNKQAPLLDWPPEVADEFTAWGRQWPENVDDSFVARTILDYIQVYPKYVDNVYQSFRPFDFEEGTGIVVAPPKEMLLRPATFSVAKPPTLGQIWGSQQRLWVQRTVLDVIGSINKNAQKWESAPVKEITGLEVAAPAAQDQKSVAKGELLELAPEIVKPGTPVAATESTGAVASGYQAMMQQFSGGMGGMSGGGASKTAPEEVYVLASTSPTQKYQVIPVFVSVLIEQNRVLDLIAAFENSPMTIKVVDIELSRPAKFVAKPEKGQTNPTAGYGSMGGGGMGEMILGSYGMMGGGYGGSGEDYQQQMMSSMRQGQGYGGMMRGGGMGAEPAKKKGTDIRQEQLKRIRERQEKGKTSEEGDEADLEAEDTSGAADPYFNVVEVRIYGQARFYNPPPPEEPTPETGLPTDEETGLSADGEMALPLADDPSTAAPSDASTDTDAAVESDEMAPPADDSAVPVEGTPAPADETLAPDDQPATPPLDSPGTAEGDTPPSAF